MKDLEYIKRDLKQSVGEKLYAHCINVMNTSVELAKRYGESTDSAMLAGLLHDCGKLYGKNIGNLEHAKLGSELAKDKYEIKDISILDAILYHTTGRKNMTLLEKIVYIADKIEPDRNYQNVDMIRELAYKSLDRSIILSLDNTFEYLKSRNIAIDEQSLVTYNYLIKNI